MAAFYSLLCKAIKKQPARRFGRLFWRSGRDSNPRAIARKLISSRSRYDHFDTSPYMSARHFSQPFSDEKGLWKELTERTAKYSVFRTV